MIKILFLAANPVDTNRLQIDEEARAIDAAILQGQYRDQFDVCSHWAVQIHDLQELLLRYRPDIIHFSGHGSDKGEIILQSEQGKSATVPASALSNLFRLFKDDIRCVVLSACYAERQAASIAQHIDCVVGMADEFSDDAARNFAVAFYRGLGYGRTIQESFDLGCSQIELAGLDEQHKPKLVANRIDPSRVSILDGLQQRNPRNTAPKPPADFVARPVEYNALKNLLLGDRNAPVGITGIRGSGGYGKTTLAQKLCHDPEVIQHFPDGIFWVGLSQEPGELTSRVLNLVENLIDRRPGSTTLDAARGELTKALDNKKCLVVIDDVWQAAHLSPFLQGGPNCTRLVTTRVNTVLPGEASRINVDAMQSNEATQLLGADLGEGGEVLKKLAARLGEYPLLLRIINAVLCQFVGIGSTLNQAIADINQALSEEGLGAFQNPASTDERHTSVAAAISVSLRLLSERECQLYGMLAVFPEDADIPLATVAQLWHLPQLATKMLCIRLANLSLLLRFDHDTIRLHDVVRTYLCEQQDNVAILHSNFLDNYKLTDWTALPRDEPYLWDRLAYHLVEARRSQELTSLFDDDRWLQARVAHGGYVYDGYIDDLNRSWEKAHAAVLQQIHDGEMPTAIALSVHYALIRTSINSLSSNYEPALVGRAVEIGFWSTERALSIAYKVSGMQKRAEMIITILNSQRCSQQQRGNAGTRALEAALEVRDERSKAQVLATLAPHLNEDLLSQALQTALVMQDERSQSNTLIALAPHLNEDLLSRALQATLAIRNKKSQSQVLATLVSLLNGYLLPQAWQAALAMQNAWAQADILVALVPYLNEDLLSQALQAALAMRNEELQVRVFVALAPHLNEDLLSQALQAVLAMRNKKAQSQVLATLVPHLNKDLLSPALQAALAIQDEWSRADTLIALAPHLEEEQRGIILPQALQAALMIRDERSQAKTLIALAPHLHDDLLPQALQAVLAMRHEEAQAKTLIALAPHLYDDLLPQALQAVLAMRDEELRAGSLIALGQLLQGALLEQILQAVLVMRDEESKAKTLIALAPRLHDDLLPQALDAALAMKSKKLRADALIALAPHLDKEQRGVVLLEALQTALAMQFERPRADILIALAPHLHEDLLPQAWEAALAMKSKKLRADALIALAPHLGKEQRDFAPVIQDEESQAKALDTLVSHASGQPNFLQPFHTAIVDHLWKNLPTQQRPSVLQFIANESLFRPPVLDQNTLAAIAQSISDICFKWRWL